MNVGTRFLEMMCACIRGRRVDWNEPLQEAEWDALVQLAKEQNVLPMLMECVYDCKAFLNQPEQWRGMIRQVSMRMVISQTMQTAAFLTLFGKIQEAGLHPLVMKGISCRALYPSPDSRPSSDEDLLVSREEFPLAAAFLTEQGFESTTGEINTDREFEIGLVRRDGMYLELHCTPFSPDSSALGDFNVFFEEAVLRANDLEVNGKSVSVMEPHDHMLYLLLHAYKHLIHSGFGVRQVCDIILWAERYGDKIDWNLLQEQCRQVRAWKFALSLFRIGREYLEFQVEKAGIPQEFLEEDVPYKEILEDLLDGGIYGAKDSTRQHSSTVTLRTVESERKGESYTLLQTLFPGRDKLAGRYTYLNRSALLLPVAWGQRLWGYGMELCRNKQVSDGADSLKIGKERVELLRKLDIID